MQPNNPAPVIGGLPDNSFGGGQPPAGPPQGQPPARPQPFNPQQYMAPINPGPQDQGYGQFAPPESGTPDIFGEAARQQPGNVPQPQGYQYPPAGPPQAPGSAPAVPQGFPPVPGQPAPYTGQPGYMAPQPPAPVADPNQPPAWALELQQMMQQNNQQQPGQPPENWKPRTWEDVDKRIEERATQMRDEEKRAEQTAQAAEDARVNTILQDIDNQLNTMTYYGQIPPIQDPNNPNDSGRLYRRELIGLANATNSTNLVQLNQAVAAAHKAGMHFDTTQNQFVGSAPGGGGYTPSGQQVPIAGGGGAPAPSSQLPPIGQLRRSSVGELMQGLTSELGQSIG